MCAHAICVVSTVLQFWIGWRFHRGAWKALRRGVANMDVLVALGTDASYFYSVISVLHHRLVQHDAHHYVPTVRPGGGGLGGKGCEGPGGNAGIITANEPLTTANQGLHAGVDSLCVGGSGVEVV